MVVLAELLLLLLPRKIGGWCSDIPADAVSGCGARSDRIQFDILMMVVQVEVVCYVG
jgi:hypothetical protein